MTSTEGNFAGNELCIAACVLVEKSVWIASRYAVALLFALSALSTSVWAVPSAKIGRPALIDSVHAEMAYPIGSDTTHTYTLGSSAPVPNEIVELSKALGNDLDNIYDFVSYYVDTVFMFGAQKGAIGALVDKSGTPFDQAELMVALLRQAAINDPVNHNYTASYKLGTITLTAAQFSAWTNISNAQAACDLLASGGVPATVNGLTGPLLCTSINPATSLTTVTLEHIWVDVAIGSTHYVFDPSYKNYAFTAGVNLASAAGLSTGQAMTAATGTGYSSGNDTTYPSVSYVKNLTAAALNTQLATYAGNLQNYIQTQSNPSSVPLVSAKIINLVGGREIAPCATPCAQIRQSTLPYTSSVSRTWTGNVPDQFRASMAITLTKANSAGTFDTTINNLVLFADDIYGRKLIYDTSFVNQAPTSFAGSLLAVDEFNNSTLLSSYSSTDNPGYSVGNITIVVNHPYVADANPSSTSTPGTYMDTTVSRPVRYSTPFTIVHGWGETNRGLVDKWASRPNTNLPANIPPNGCDYTCTSGHRGNKGDANREQLAALWLMQSSKAARLHATIANAIYTHHHTIGIVAGDSEVATTNLNPNGPPDYRFSIAENFDRIDADTGFSVISTTSDAVARRVAIHAIAATMEALEGSVSAQQSDLPDTVSTATRFEWGNAPPSTEDPSGYGARRFFDLTSSNVSNLPSMLLVEGAHSTTQTGVHGGANPILGQIEVQSRQSAVDSILTGYTSAGFRVISSEEAFLGPGQRGGSFILQSGTQYVHRYSKQRGGAFVAMLFDANGDPLEIAHVAVNVNQDGSTFYGIKGGGGGTQADQQSNYDPAMAADILKGQFVDKSEVLGVDLLTGGLTYTSPASLTVGNGNFPYSLSANLTWRGGIEQDQAFSNVSHVAPNTPWTTNWNSTLTISGSALEAMGENDIRAAAGTVAAFLAMQDVYKSAVSAQREVAAVLVGSWWTHQITGNVASVSVGTETRQFLQKTDPTTHLLTWFASGPKGFANLAQTGQRVVYTEPNCASGGASYVLTRGWDYSGVSFAVTNANGDQQNFAFWDNTYSNGGAFCAFLHGFRLSSWTFPYGMTVNLSYAPRFQWA